MFKKSYPGIFVFVLWSCGAGSDDSNVITPTDTISSEARVRFNSTNDTIEVLERGADPQSEIFAACAFTMNPITGALPYDLVDQNKLQLGTGSFDYKRPLKTPQSELGVEDRIFSVWGSPNVLTDGITLSLELEVEPELLTFRMICTG
jgi:hypothetical protein